MGQYHVPVNLTKREYINPHALGDGLKLMEQVCSGAGGTGSALLLLVAASNGEQGRGGGDYHAEDPDNIVGRWAGDRIALVGDYAEADDLPEEDVAEAIYDLCGNETPAEVAQGQRGHAAELEARAAAYPQHADSYHESAARIRAQADIIEQQQPYTDITEQVREAIQRDGLIKYKVGEYGFIRRGFADDPEFRENTKGKYKVSIKPPLSGEYEGVSEFIWECNHYVHAQNKAAKRGLVVQNIEFLG